MDDHRSSLKDTRETSPSEAAFIEKLKRSDVRSVARALSLVESGSVRGKRLVELLFQDSGSARTIGVTGSPGAGKSTLVDAMASQLLAGGARVAILAVDPSSPYTGGALLGDRIRMSSVASHPNCFVRSMASRGALGGLAPKAAEAVTILDAAGYDHIIIETVGVGQAEVEIVRHVDSVVLVLVPGMGDGVQALKAGIIEIADIFVINKADYPGVSRLKRELTSVFSLAGAGSVKPVVLEAVASEAKGIEELIESLASRYQHATAEEEIAKRRRESLMRQVGLEVKAQALSETFNGLSSERRAEINSQLVEREVSPAGVARSLLQQAKF